MRTYETKKFIPIFNSADINAGADSDSVDMKNFSHIALICMFGPSLSGNAILKLYEGAADATKTTALTFHYTYGGAATGSASSDVLETPADSAALTCTGTTFVSRMLIIELDAAEMTDGLDWLTLEVGAEASAGQLTVVAVCDPRYASMAGDTGLT